MALLQQQEQNQLVEFGGEPEELFIYPTSSNHEIKSLTTPEFKEVFGPDDIVFVMNEVKTWKTHEIKNLLEKMGINTFVESSFKNFVDRRALLKLFPDGQDYLVSFDASVHENDRQVGRVYQIHYFASSKEVNIYANGKYIGGYTVFQGELSSLETKFGLYHSYSCYNDGQMVEHQEFFNKKRVGKWYTCDIRLLGEIRLLGDTNPGMVCIYFIDGNNVSKTEYKRHLNNIKEACIVSIGNICKNLAKVIVSFV